MSQSLLNRKQVKEFIKKKTEVLRPGWDCRQVSQSAIDQLDHKLRAVIIDSVKRHPTLGKTFKQILL